MQLGGWNAVGVDGEGDVDVLERGAELGKQDLRSSGGVREFLEDGLEVEEGGEAESFVYANQDRVVNVFVLRSETERF